GESGRKRTLNRLCPREVISVFTTGVSSWVHSVRVVSTTGPGREMVQFLSGFEISFGFCVNQRWREISKWKEGESSRSASKVSVSRCRRQAHTIHCRGMCRGSSLMVTRAFSNQWVAKLKCACSRLALNHWDSTRRPRVAHAASTHCKTNVPRLRL